MSADMRPVDVDLSKVSQLGNRLLTELNVLREHDPIHWSDASRCWVITRHQDVLDGFSGRLPLSSCQFPAALGGIIPPEEHGRRLPNAVRYVSRFATNLDPPDHTRLRKLRVRAVNKSLVESVRPFVRQRVQELLARAERTGHLLAKMQLSEFFSALVQRFDGVDILDNELHFMPQLVFRGLHGLNVRFHPRG